MRYLAYFALMLCIVALTGVLMLGCQPAAPDGVAALTQAEDHTSALSGQVGAAATQATSAGQAVVATAQQGASVTPPADKTVLDPYWMRLIGLGQGIVAQGDNLQSIRVQIDQLRSEVAAGKQQLTTALAALDAEKQARAADNQAWEKKLAAANSAWETMFRRVAWIAIAAIGLAVAAGFLLHDFQISIAGGAGGLAVVLACMVLGQVQHWLPWIVGGLVVVVVAWVLIEWYLRGSLAAAIKTNPLQDMEDLLKGAASTANAVGVGAVTAAGVAATSPNPVLAPAPVTPAH